MEIKGLYDTAVVYTDNIEQEAIDQIKTLMDQPMALYSHTRIMPDTHAGAGCVIGYTAKVTDKIVPNLIGVDIGCLDGDTEFLTMHGWKKIKDYSVQDKVLQYDKETDKASFVTPIHYINKPSDGFYHFSNSKGLDQMLSADHKMLIWKGYKTKGYKLHDYSPTELIEFSLEKGYYGIKAAFTIDQQGIDFSYDELRLLVATQADGCIRTYGDIENGIEFHLRKERKIKRLKVILLSLNIPYKEYVAKDKSTYIIFSYNNKISKDLSILWSANYEQLKVITNEVLLWDGHKGYRSFYSSTTKENADIIQFAFSAIGVRAGISETRHTAWNTIYTVTPTKNPIIGVTNVSFIEQEGNQYCFTVPSGYFVIRRNNKVSITGNCGVLAVNLPISYERIKDSLRVLDSFVRNEIPSGREINTCQQSFLSSRFVSKVKEVCMNTGQDFNYVINSLGSLGGGNHFIEIDKNDTDDCWLLIHSGSRNFGLKIANFHQRKARERNFKEERSQLIAELKSQYTGEELGKRISEIKIKKPETGLEYLEGSDLEDYAFDMAVAQEFASVNRKMIASKILRFFHQEVNHVLTIESVHNYIDFDQGIIRKGAIDASKGEKVVIPLNMRDGVILGIGKGNEDWNFSAPHGSGRTMSRTAARKTLSLTQFQETMSGIYSTSVTKQTIDEAPEAYKPSEEIIKYLEPTVEVWERLYPIWNFKAVE